MSLVAAAPMSLAAVDDQCSAIEAWAEQCESVPELRDATNKLAAIDEYLNRTSTEGRGRVAAAMRRLEVRIGKLIGPPPTPQESGARKGSVTTETSNGLSKDQRSEFRQMAENEDKVEQVIATSTDEEPASRRKVLDRIRDVSPLPKVKDRRPPLADTAKRAAWDFRKAVERLDRIASDDRFAANKQQVAAHWRGHLSYAIEVCQDLLDGFDHQSQED